SHGGSPQGCSGPPIILPIEPDILPLTLIQYILKYTHERAAAGHRRAAPPGHPAPRLARRARGRWDPSGGRGGGLWRRLAAPARAARGGRRARAQGWAPAPLSRRPRHPPAVAELSGKDVGPIPRRSQGSRRGRGKEG